MQGKLGSKCATCICAHALASCSVQCVLAVVSTEATGSSNNSSRFGNCHSNANSSSDNVQFCAMQYIDRSDCTCLNVQYSHFGTGSACTACLCLPSFNCACCVYNQVSMLQFMQSRLMLSMSRMASTSCANSISMHAIQAGSVCWAQCVFVVCLCSLVMLWSV